MNQQYDWHRKLCILWVPMSHQRVSMSHQYQVIFEKCRYFYEFYKGYTIAEQAELGEYWYELGTPRNKADIQYFPLELTCLNEALEAFIESRLKKLQHNRPPCGL
ncbi:hypothetical protein OQJ62_15950 [Microbulbifer thermotolerans]|uniref:hypothetical protein n=1 Tax=Microbulbifer thermotolerans TaxID=252514 RepID=UPI0022498AF5|nr:hypothetical protein [Microbulbifer thermotolerans]MCX2796418.1 hypothetical protein [Microbulbifer thermotolerans]